MWSRTTASQLDPDGNGIACDALLPVPGFAPATWTDRIPAGLKEAQLVSITDGDTFDVLVDGVRDTVRIYRADTPETYFEPQCGGDEATAFTTWALGFNDSGATIYLEQDETKRDPSGRLLAYVWFTVDGLPYLLNEAIIRAGWGEDINYGDEIYDRELVEAAAFAKDYNLGVYDLCGGFGLPNLQQGLVAPTAAPAQASAECDPSYPDSCIPPVWVYGDLDCKHVPDRRFRVLPPDPHRFDGDDNGIGCESYETPYVGLP